MNRKRIIVISSCLVGMNTTYTGESNRKALFVRMLERGEVVPVCPEQLGGLTTPRLPSEIEHGCGQDVINGKARVIHNNGMDVTANFLRGAKEVLRLARSINPPLIIFKERSPSCGVHRIYDGSFSNVLVEGEGVTTALLRRHGFRVVSEIEFRQNQKKGA